MNEFAITLRQGRSSEPDEAGELAIYAKGVVLTRLLRQNANHEDDFVKVPLTRLGFWLADNWWRLRYEPRPPTEPTVEWRQAHEIASIGGGYAWPRLTLWGEGQRMVLVCRADPVGVVGPVRFLTDALTFVSAEAFETAVDNTLNSIRQQAVGDDAKALDAVVGALNSERQSTEAATWRRLEAIAGYDVDEAPDQLMRSLGSLAGRYTEADIEEVVAAHPGPTAASTFERLLAEAPASALVEADFGDAVKIGLRELTDQAQEPWQLAESVAGMLRSHFDFATKPISNPSLAQLLGVRYRDLKSRRTHAASSHPYGLRIRPKEHSRHNLLLRTSSSEGRRFEAARLLGDAIWSRSSPLGITSRVRTARQKFQNAFAASLLCPADALIRYLGSDAPADDAITGAARHFQVSEPVVRTILVNKYVMERQRLQLPVEDLRRGRSDEEFLAAA